MNTNIYHHVNSDTAVELFGKDSLDLGDNVTIFIHDADKARRMAVLLNHIARTLEMEAQDNAS